MQMQDELEIEMQVWSMVDGHCSAEEAGKIQALISFGGVWKQKYEEIMVMHHGLLNELELEHPGMRFTQNVMDSVAMGRIAPATRTYINIWIVRGLAAFFVGAVALCFAYALRSISFKEGSSSLEFARLTKFSSGLALPESPGFMYGLFFLIIIGGLLLLDGIIKRSKTLYNS
jgi:hypothetical protein